MSGELIVPRLVESFGKELMDPNLDLGIDYAQQTLDFFWENNVLQGIPVVKTLVTLAKAGFTVREAHAVKKLVCFLREYHNGEMSDKGRAFKAKLAKDERFRRKTSDRLLVLIDRQKTEDNAILLAKLFGAHIEGAFGWEVFIYFCHCLEGVHEIDFKVLRFLQREPSTAVKEIAVPCVDPYMVLASVHRLKTFGFVDFHPMTWAALEDDFDTKVKVSSLGSLLLEALA